MVGNYGATMMESHVFKYGMRLYPFDMFMPPSNGLVCVSKGGRVNLGTGGLSSTTLIHLTRQLQKNTSSIISALRISR